jgi:hypothetical protein
MGVQGYVATAEDAILSKLEWSRIGQSERQFEDALGIAEVSGKSLDIAYLRFWARSLM